MATNLSLSLWSIIFKVLSIFVLRVASTSWCKGGSLDCWNNRLIYQVITDRFARADDDTAPCSDLRTYCGGTFRGILKQLDYIEGLGAEAIWIDPITKNSPGGYMGFWPISLHTINPHYGTEEDFRTLVDELHRRGMLIMIGLTANSMGHHWSDIPTMDPPFNDPSMFHGCTQCQKEGGGHGGVGCNGTLCDCWIEDYNNHGQDIWCQLYGLPDVNQGDPTARNALLSYARDIVRRFDIDGVRIDAVPYMPEDFWADFSAASAVMSMGEVEVGDDRIVHRYVAEGAMNSTLNYPLYYQLLNCFTLSDPTGDRHNPKSRWGLNSLPKFYKMQKANYGDITKVLGNFVSNHDQARLDRVVEDPMLQKAMLLTSLTWEGMPIIYYGLEQNLRTQELEKYSFDAYRSPLWQHGYSTESSWYRWIAAIGQLRKRMPKKDFAQAKFNPLWSQPDLLVFARGRIIVAVTNGGSSGPAIRQSITVEWDYDWKHYRDYEYYHHGHGQDYDHEYYHHGHGIQLCNIFNTTDCVRVDNNGAIDLVLLNGESKVYAPTPIPSLTALAEQKKVKDEDLTTLIM